MKVEFNIPTKWEELTDRQLVWVSWILTSSETRTEEEIQVLALKTFSGLEIVDLVGPGVFACKMKGKEFNLSSEDINFVRKKLAYLTTSFVGVKPLSRMAGRRAHDPMLQGMPFAQYLAIENYYQAFIFTKNPEHLAKMAAAYYCAPFDDSQTEKRSRDFMRIAPHILHTAFMWYIGLKETLRCQFPNLFSYAETEEEDGEPTPPDMRKQIANMMRMLSAGDVTRHEAIYNVDTWAALEELDAKAMEVAEMNKRLNTSK